MEKAVALKQTMRLVTVDIKIILLAKFFFSSVSDECIIPTWDAWISIQRCVFFLFLNIYIKQRKQKIVIIIKTLENTCTKRPEKS